MPDADIDDMDPGLARERTQLAWTRTALSFAALGAALLKVSLLAGIPAVAVGGVVWGLGRVARPSGRPGRKSRRGLLLLMTLAVTAVSLAALAVALLVHGSGFAPR